MALLNLLLGLSFLANLFPKKLGCCVKCKCKKRTTLICSAIKPYTLYDKIKSTFIVKYKAVLKFYYKKMFQNYDQLRPTFFK